MSLLVLKKGWLCSVQDLGRPGYAQYGINRSGAMDPLALQVGNYLLGNPGSCAALEMCFPGPAFLFLEPALMVLAGGDFEASLDGKRLDSYRPAWVAAGSTLAFQRKKSGQYVYLCIQGGLEVESWLNSQSTNLKAEHGGWKGRNIQKGEVLSLKNQIPAAEVPASHCAKYWAALDEFYPANQPIRFIPGQHYAHLQNASRTLFFDQNWQISIASDRMGYRLEGKKLELKIEKSLLSTGLSRGSIQLPPSGQPIILMADHQTTGGYPLLGQVIQADWPRLAQMPPGQSIQFQSISLAEANAALLDQIRFLQQMKRSAAWALKKFNKAIMPPGLVGHSGDPDRLGSSPGLL